MAGFLFQLTGTLALTVTARLNSAIDSDGDIVVQVRGMKSVTAERWDQDALVTGLSDNHDDTLVQFKWTGEPERDIKPAELLEICEGLVAGAKRASANGIDVDSFVLSSNRRLSPRAADVERKAKAGAKRAKGWSAKCWHVLESVVVHFISGTNGWRRQLERFGATLGCPASQVNDGIDRLLGKLAALAAQGNDAPLTPMMIAAQIMQASESEPLLSSNVRVRAAQACKALLTPYHLEDDAYIRRRLVTEIATAAQSSPLVAVVGEGGDGKTVALAQWVLHRLCDTADSFSAFTAFELARDLQQPWLRDVLAGWGNTKPASAIPETLTLDDLIERVDRANTALAQVGKPPTLALAVDGIDESADGSPAWTLMRAFGRRLITQDRAAPRATLIVSCRDSKSIRDAAVPNPTCTPRLPGTDGIGVVKVPEFSPEELEEVGDKLRPGLGTRVANAARAALSAGTGSPQAQVQLGMTDALVVSDPTPSALAVGRALLHPSMWNAFRLLEQAEQEAALDGDKVALQGLARGFIAWFVGKACLRNGGAWRAANVLPAVADVAERVLGDQRLFGSLACWRRVDLGIGGPGSGLRILEELLSSGVARVDGQQWAWRHGFVGAYLGSTDMQADLLGGQL